MIPHLQTPIHLPPNPHLPLAALMESCHRGAPYYCGLLNKVRTILRAWAYRNTATNLWVGQIKGDDNLYLGRS